MLAVVYVWKVVEVAFFRDPPEATGSGSKGRIPLSMLLPAAVLLLATVVFGVWTEPTLGTAASAVEYLLSFWQSWSRAVILGSVSTLADFSRPSRLRAASEHWARWH